VCGFWEGLFTTGIIICHLKFVVLTSPPWNRSGGRALPRAVPVTGAGERQERRAALPPGAECGDHTELRAAGAALRLGPDP